MKKIALFTAVFAALSVTLMARQYSKSTCKTQKCTFKADFGEGPILLEDFYTGVCKSCQKVVEVHWSKQGPKPKVHNIWDPETGKSKVLFSCPHCQKLVIEVKDRKEFKYCPKCNKPHVNIDEPYMVDD